MSFFLGKKSDIDLDITKIILTYAFVELPALCNGWSICTFTDSEKIITYNYRKDTLCYFEFFSLPYSHVQIFEKPVP